MKLLRNFIKGRMNKSFDERLVPPGEYVDALNVRLGSTELSEVGAVENSKGNTQLTTLSYDGLALSSQTSKPQCIGAFEDGMTETMYWFVHQPTNTSSVAPLDMIVSYNTTSQTLRYHVISTNGGLGSGTASTLNFNPAYLITGVNLVGDLLFFTDNLNPPRKINVNSSYPIPSASHIDKLKEEDISVIQRPPGFQGSEVASPTVSLVLEGEENFMLDRFISFAYRYRYLNGEYSATSLYSLPAFSPGAFAFSTSDFNNSGMENRYNGADVSFNTGSKHVTEVEIIFKLAGDSTLFVIENFNKEDQGWGDNSLRTIRFNNSKIFTTLLTSELLRLYDNVPRTAQAQTIMGNRLMYGNYVDGYNLTDSLGNALNLAYTTEGISSSITTQVVDDGPAVTNGTSYTVVCSLSQAGVNNKISFDFANSKADLKAGTTVFFTLEIAHQDLSTDSATPWTCDGWFTPTPWDGNPAETFTVAITLQQDFVNDVSAFAASTEFQNAIGTVLNVNMNPIATSGDGTSLTDRFNTYLQPPGAAYTCAPPTGVWEKDFYGRTNCVNEQGFQISVAGDVLSLELPAMRYTYNPAGSDNNVFAEYFQFDSGSVDLRSTTSIRSLHSNRDYEIGIVYMDTYGRSTTALVSRSNTVFFDPNTSNDKNQIKVTIPTVQIPPSWATNYKFVCQPSAGNYNTVYSNISYKRASDNHIFFRLEGENQTKVQTGDILTVKRDSNGAVNSFVTAAVLDIAAQSSDFLENGGSQLAGLYMEMSPRGWVVSEEESDVIAFGPIDRNSNSSNCSDNPVVDYPITLSESPYDIPSGSVIQIDWSMSRAHKNDSCAGYDYTYSNTFVADADYDSFYEWYRANLIDLTTGSENNFGGNVLSFTNISLNPSPDTGVRGPLTSCAADVVPAVDCAATRIYFKYDEIVASGDAYAPATKQLFDLGKNFINTVSVGDIVTNLVTLATASVVTVDSETLLTLFSDIFPGPSSVVKDAYKIVHVGGACPRYLTFQSELDKCRGNRSYLSAEITVTKANSLMVWETQPEAIGADVFFESSQMYKIENDLHMGGTAEQIAAGNQDQTSSAPALITTAFSNCYSFGNGVESYRILDSMSGRPFYLGERTTSVLGQDFVEADRVNDITYSGVFNDNSNLNNLNVFNLGQANYKTCDQSFGPIQVLHGMSTDILVLQEDKISYVMVGKDLLSDAGGGGALTSVPYVLGQQIARVEDFGISFNPESFAEWGQNMFFTDAKRGAVIKLIGDGRGQQLEEISSLGMESWFRDLFYDKLTTQKLGAYDPYMNEYVLTANSIQLPLVVPPIPCGVTLAYTGKNTVLSYTVDVGEAVGDVVIPINVSAGEIAVSATWNSALSSVTVTAASSPGSITISKTTPQPTTVDIVITPSEASDFDITVPCVEETLITVVSVVLTSAGNQGASIHSNFNWNDGTTTSPVDNFLVNFQATSPAYYNAQSGPRGSGIFPYDGVNLVLNTEKTGTDTFDFVIGTNTLNWLSSNTLYTNSSTDISSLINAMASITGVNNPSTGVSQATESSASIPIGNQYLYLVWDLRDYFNADLCYSAASLTDACCDCTEDCDTFTATKQHSSSAAACNDTSVNLTFKTNRAQPDDLEVGDRVYTTACTSAYWLPSGWYKVLGIGATVDYPIFVGNNGIITAIDVCR